MKDAHIAQLLLQALETEIGGTQAYVTATKCAINEPSKTSSTDLGESPYHLKIMEALLVGFDLDRKATGPGRKASHHIGSQPWFTEHGDPSTPVWSTIGPRS